MKLLAIQLILFVILLILCLCAREYSWIPLVAMFIPVLLLAALVFNWPVIGLLAAKIEAGRRLFIIILQDGHTVDTYLITGRDVRLRVLHVRRRKSGYRHWVIALNK